MRFHKRGSNTDGQLLRKEFCFVQPEYCLLMGEELLFVLYQTKNENWMRTKLLLPRQFYGLLYLALTCILWRKLV